MSEEYLNYNYKMPVNKTKMKNIHLLPTDKPSRLWVNNLRRRLELENENLIGSNTAQHIYITSDKEIKGDWVYYEIGDLKGIYKIVNSQRPKTMVLKKIILTTDQDLINDGVQSIDDEFLEWFVKNPSCEFVEINKEYLSNTGEWKEVLLPSEWEVDTKFRYKIIIPQEEPKEFKGRGIIYLIGKERKQETLEEAAEKWNEKQTTLEFGKPHNAPNRIKAFINGAKWQAEKMYNEKEVLELLRKSHFVEQNIEEWFEQHKKK
jgi:hypothetical protein